MNGREKIPMFYWFLNKFAISNLYYKILLISGLQPSLTYSIYHFHHEIETFFYFVRVSPHDFTLTPTKVPIGTYHRQVIHMKSKASTTTLSSITTQSDFRLVTHPDFSPHSENNNPPKWDNKKSRLYYVSWFSNSSNSTSTFTLIYIHLEIHFVCDTQN